jgi:tetratricopeptide (TPR) repeat protein
MHGAENVAHFFDWLTTPFDGLLNIIERDFEVFYPEGLVLLNDQARAHGVKDLPTGVIFYHQFPVFRGNMQPDFLLHYPAFIAKFRHLAGRFRQFLAERPVTLLRQEATREQALALEALVTARYPGADVRFLYILSSGDEFETPLGHARLLRQDGSLGDPAEWARVLGEEGLIGQPYRHATTEILGAAHDDHNLAAENRFSEAQLRIAVAANPQQLGYRLELAHFYAQRGQWRQAEDEALIALARAPHEPEAMYMAALAQYRCGHLAGDEAVRHLLALLQSPKALPSWFGETSVVLLEQGDTVAALHSIRGAVARAADVQHYYFQQAECQFRLNDMAGLTMTLEAARRLSALPAHYDHLLANGLEALGRMDDALAAVERACRDGKAFHCLFTKAGLLIQFGRYEEALAACREAEPQAGGLMDALRQRMADIEARLAPAGQDNPPDDHAIDEAIRAALA